MKRPAEIEFAMPSPSYDAPSPASSSSSSSPDHPAAPPRKRARSDVTPEERKDARAHRNRIAAQNSRDKRKAQFSYLEQRVAELEEENRRLRTGMGFTETSRAIEQKNDEREKDRAKEQENEELKQRIKTLEAGWEAVVKALAASGLPLNVPPSSAAPTSALPAPSSTSGHLSQATTFPVFAPATTTYPISPAPSTPSSAHSISFGSDELDSTRHLARVATADAPPLSSAPQQRVEPNTRRTFPSWSSTQSHCRRPQRTARSHRWTMSSWTTSCATSSRLPLSCRRHLWLLARTPPSRSPRPPGPAKKYSWRRPPPRQP